MNRCLPLLAVSLSLLLTPALARASGDATADAAVRKPLEAYLEAQRTGDGALIRQAFWPEGHLVFVKDGKLTTLSAEAFAARFTGKPSPGAEKVRRSIERVEVSGPAATATLVLDGPTHRITDFMTLLQVSGEWRIIHKSFYAEPKAGPAAAK
jgi:hypothetical protein